MTIHPVLTQRLETESEELDRLRAQIPAQSAYRMVLNRPVRHEEISLGMVLALPPTGSLTPEGTLTHISVVVLKLHRPRTCEQDRSRHPEGADLTRLRRDGSYLVMIVATNNDRHYPTGTTVLVNECVLRRGTPLLDSRVVAP